jgi:hypothetical protein
MDMMAVCVTPHVSKPHDYINHMFIRPYVLIKFEVQNQIRSFQILD